MQRKSSGLHRFVPARVTLVLSFFAMVAEPTSAKDQLFRFKKPDAQSVGLAGEFNGWKAQPMSKGGDGMWTVAVSLSPGTYGYKFLVNGTDWIFDPENQDRKKVDGIENSVIEVTDGNSATPGSIATAKPGPSAAVAPQSFNFNVLAERKRFEFDRSGNEHTVTTKEKWGYKVTIENKNFKTIANLEIQYREFKFDDALRGSSNIVGIGGSTAMPTLETGQKFVFETTPVEVERLELKTGWAYYDGAKAKVKDALAGLWIRVLSGGELVFEWQTPSELKTKAQWE